MTLETPADRSRALWRRQAVLTLLVAAALGVVALLSDRVLSASNEAAARARLLLPAPDTRPLVIALAVAVAITIALLGAVCVHAYRIVTLTFRRYED